MANADVAMVEAKAATAINLIINFLPCFRATWDWWSTLPKRGPSSVVYEYTP